MKKKVIYIDVDETICTTAGDSSEARDYTKAQQLWENIKKANKLYEEGHTIVYWTARGCLTKIDWTEVTTKQFEDWGVKFHDLKCNKPFYDFFIDDKNINTRDWHEDTFSS